MYIKNKIKNMNKTDVNPCCVCREYERTNLFVRDNNSCGHVCVCEECASKLDKCPICRFEGTSVSVYL